LETVGPKHNFSNAGPLSRQFISILLNHQIHLNFNIITVVVD